MLTVNDIKKASYNFIASYKKVYNDKNKRNEFLLKWTGEDDTFEKSYCISVDLVAKAVSKHFNIDCKKVEDLLINSKTNNLPKVHYHRDKKGSYNSGAYNHYYYLGDIK
jgi:hypothetical protein